MYICIYKGRQREAASLGLHALSREQDRGGISALHWSHAATSSSLKAAKGPFFFSFFHLVVTFTNNTRCIMEEGYSQLWNSSCWGDLGTQTGKALVHSERPICRADRGPVRLCEQAFGTAGTVGRQTGQWGGGGGGSKCTAGWTTSVTPCFRFPWRQDQTLSTLPPQSLFPPARAALTHHTLTAW